jgi:hypothetical protein
VAGAGFGKRDVAQLQACVNGGRHDRGPHREVFMMASSTRARRQRCRRACRSG